jgi:hypothetical protein
MKKHGFVKDYLVICKNCEHSDRTYNKTIKWFCQRLSRKVFVSPDKQNCKHFILDYDLDCASGLSNIIE